MPPPNNHCGCSNIRGNQLKSSALSKRLVIELYANSRVKVQTDGETDREREIQTSTAASMRLPLSLSDYGECSGFSNYITGTGHVM